MLGKSRIANNRMKKIQKNYNYWLRSFNNANYNFDRIL